MNIVRYMHISRYTNSFIQISAPNVSFHIIPLRSILLSLPFSKSCYDLFTKRKKFETSTKAILFSPSEKEYHRPRGNTFSFYRSEESNLYSRFRENIGGKEKREGKKRKDFPGSDCYYSVRKNQAG